jgi:hypothetical protein
MAARQRERLDLIGLIEGQFAELRNGMCVACRLIQPRSESH